MDEPMDALKYLKCVASKTEKTIKMPRIKTLILEITCDFNDLKPNVGYVQLVPIK